MYSNWMRAIHRNTFQKYLLVGVEYVQAFERVKQIHAQNTMIGSGEVNVETLIEECWNIFL